MTSSQFFFASFHCLIWSIVYYNCRIRKRVVEFIDRILNSKTHSCISTLHNAGVLFGVCYPLKLWQPGRQDSYLMNPNLLPLSKQWNIPKVHLNLAVSRHLNLAWSLLA